MIAADSCVWIDFFNRTSGVAAQRLAEAVNDARVVMPPPVLTELLSNPARNALGVLILKHINMLELKEDYWQRAGLLRAKIRKLGHKANLGDALIAQSCIDHRVPLLTTDTDFRHYAKAGGLKLA
jgi:predicted nucleic acid-binding protein